ncbi:TRAP transporter large permease [Allopusillimonas soli]|uniref:TRAP transporter large permease protein n=1 Tax=Allopusillimonas soli TaxID=659016 RepID=A0A853FED4_9BURK|nr:TRAP transporter large permease [Allopusillimonas soli]NYT37180.1 TRAP transporter large permease [Allopusillimonas soli]TEA74818.1 TRAP transporter large permease [Allopusillimonas soli]
MIAAFMLVALLALLFTGIPIFAGLTLYGGGLLLLVQGNLGSVVSIIFGELNQYLLVAIPLFAFMAHVMIRGKVVDDLYDAAYTFTRHLPGGLAVATIMACTVFAAISGSSVATALTIGAVAIPQMLRYGYSPRIAYGVVAAGGTLGILIPPSGPMILYGITTDTSIGGLFIAGIVPGLVMALVFMAWAVFRCATEGEAVKRDARASGREMLQALRKSVWSIALPVFVLGGMYLGVFTATEAAAAGVWLALFVTIVIYRTVGWREIWASAQDACRLSAMLFMILAGAAVFSHVLTKMRVPQQIVESLAAMDMGAMGFVVVMMLLIVVLGMFLESISIILVTTPVILPAMIHLGIDPIWYGVLLVINLEIALITPPVGMNLFTIKAITGSKLGPIIRGSLPYMLLMGAVLVLILLVPGIALWLPRTMMGG